MSNWKQAVVPALIMVGSVGFLLWCGAFRPPRRGRGAKAAVVVM